MAAFLLVHGIPGSAATWNGVASRLRDCHDEVLVPDLLGFGDAPVPEVADALLAHNQARHVLSELDRAHLDRVIVVGHDFGGPVAAHLIAAAPDRVAAVALFATNVFPDTSVPFPLSMLNLPRVGAVAQRLLFSRPALAMMVRRGAGRPRPVLDLAVYVGDARRQEAIRTIFANSLRRLGNLYTPVERVLSTTRVPALVGWGDRDPFFPVEVGRRTAALLPGSRFRVYEDAGHFLPEERPQAIAEDLRELASHLRPR